MVKCTEGNTIITVDTVTTYGLCVRRSWANNIQNSDIHLCGSALTRSLYAALSALVQYIDGATVERVVNQLQSLST